MPFVHQSFLVELVCIFLNGKHSVWYFFYVVIKILVGVIWINSTK